MSASVQACRSDPSFGTMSDGRPVTRYMISNRQGMTLQAIDYGATIVSLQVPDRSGTATDVVLGYDNFDAYRSCSSFVGALVGRYANRIGHGRFVLGGHPYSLTTNEGPHHLHGGTCGFDARLWTAEPLPDAPGLRFSYVSPDGEEGYPGTLHARVTYALTPTNALIVDCKATTTKATPVSLTQHSYFNLAGHDAGDVLAHRLWLNARRFTPVDDTLLPTGAIHPVRGTPLDFTTPTPVGDRLSAAHPQMKRAGGYDHNFVLNRRDASPQVPTPAAHVWDPASGRCLTIYTTAPGLQFYSGHALAPTAGKDGASYGPRSGFCLEPQQFPDAPNRPHFPSSILAPGDRYHTRTVYSFSTHSSCSDPHP